MKTPNQAPIPAPQKVYFINAWVDYGVIGVFSILAFLALRFFYTGERTSAAITFAAQLAWICNWPHFSATSYRLYHSRDNIRQYPFTAMLVPWVVLAGVFGSFLSPAVIAPYFIKLVSIWSPYHFSGQTLGISLIYARRSGFMVGKHERFFLSSFIYGTFIAQTVRFEKGAQSFNDSGIDYPSIGLPAWTSTAAESWVYLTGIILLILIARWCLTNKRLIAPIVLLPAFTQFVWFMPGSDWLSFTEFVPFFHSLQYLLIAWSMQLKEKMDLESIQPSPGYVAAESARWGFGNFVGGALLFFGIPHFVAHFGVPVAFSTIVIVSGVQIHHFFIDGVIWKLKRKTVSSPLMVNIDELLRSPASLGSPGLSRQNA
ncbi:MAG: hypothetical protein HY077_00715 [Elusimicrobia bacterium]|nr:hypothetical protein [Elusimicrobiota bacterium]